MDSFREGVFNTLDGGRVIVSKDGGLWHLSMSYPGKIPSYEQLKSARYKYLPDDILVAQLFPPSKDFVNLHPYVLHLWQLKPEEVPAHASA